MKDQKLVVRLNISGIGYEEAKDVLAQDSLGKTWAVEKRRDTNIALVKDHFVMYWHKYGEEDPEMEQKLDLISRYSLKISSIAEMDNIHSYLNTLEVLRKNGAVCTRSFLAASIEPPRGKMSVEVKDNLTKSSLLQTMLIFEPLQIKYSTFYHEGNPRGMEDVNHLVSRLINEDNLDILLSGMGIISNTPLSQLDYAREIANAIW